MIVFIYYMEILLGLFRSAACRLNFFITSFYLEDFRTLFGFQRTVRMKTCCSVECYP